AITQRARALAGLAPSSAAGPADRAGGADAIDPAGVARWLTALVGTGAAAWPVGAIAAVPERELARALVALARRIPPRAWTLGDVEEAALGRGARREVCAEAAAA